MFVKKIGLFFDKDEGAGAGGGESDPQKDEGKDKDTAKDWTPAQQAEFDKRAKALKDSAEKEGRRKAEADFEAKQKADKDAAEKLRLESEGKYEEASKLALADKEAADQRAKDAEAKAKELELKDLFNTQVSDDQITFANPQARKDAFAAIDREKVIDVEGMKTALAEMKKTHSHYFGVASSNGNTDADKTGRKTTNTKQDQEERDSKLKERFNIRKPR